MFFFFFFLIIISFLLFFFLIVSVFLGDFKCVCWCFVLKVICLLVLCFFF